MQIRNGTATFGASLAVTAALLLTGCGNSSPIAVGATAADGSNSLPGPVIPSCLASYSAEPSGRANQGVLMNGEFVGTDEIHFARGANADGMHHEQYYAPGGVPPEPQPFPVENDDVYRQATWGAFGTDRAAHNGDYLLPTETTRWPDFTADMAFLRLKADATDLFIQLRFVSFPAPDAQIATLTFTPKSASPEVVAWPRNAGVRSAYAQALTLWGNGGELSMTGGAVSNLLALGGKVCVSNHAIEARIPLAALPAGPWKIGVGSGLADPADTTRYWTVPAGAPSASSPGTDSSTAPGSNVWDLMFTPHDPNYHDDHVQADLLLAGDVSAAVVEVSPAQLQAHASVPAPVITGRIAYTYESAFDFGDGIARGSPGTPPIPVSQAGVKPRDTAVNYEYLGGVQPYFAYIPKGYPASTHTWPLILYFHGLNNYIWEPFGLTLGLEDQLEARGYLFASLLGRGDISYTDRGELDPLEVIAHMSARYRIDPQRIYLMGHSHGAGGVLNVSRRNPDLFAAVVPAQISNAPVQPENLLYIPTIHIAGQADPIDSGAGARGRYDALSALGYDTQLYYYTLKTHENSSIYDTLPQIFDLFDRSVTPVNPATVVFTRGGGDFDVALGLLHDHAYWVSQMTAVDPAADMHITAESFGIPHRALNPALATRSGDQMVDRGGPSGRSAATYASTTPGYDAAAVLANRASITSRNLAAVSLDVSRMGINLAAADARLTLALDADLALSLRGVGGTSLSWQILDASNAVVSSGKAASVNGAFRIAVPANAVAMIFGH